MSEKGMLDKNLRDVERGRENVFEVIDTLGEQGCKKLVLSNVAVKPERQESPPRAHRFHEISGFVNYLGKFGGEKTVILVDVEGKCIHAILNEEALSGFEIVTMKPVYHPLAKPWIELLSDLDDDGDSTITQQTIALSSFTDFLAINSGCIVEPIPVELRWVLSQLKASTGTELFRGEIGKGRKESTNGLVIKTKIEGIDDKGLSINIPDQIKIKVPLFICGETMPITFDLILSLEAGIIVVKLASTDLGVQIINAFSDMIESLKTLGNNLIITYGTPAHKSWQYVK